VFPNFTQHGFSAQVDRNALSRTWRLARTRVDPKWLLVSALEENLGMAALQLQAAGFQ